MAKFRFRLEKVMDYRGMLEERAKDAYLDSRVARLEAEAELYAINEKRTRLLGDPALSLQQRRDLEIFLSSLDDQERQQKIAIDILIQDEDAKREEWHLKKQELEALVKLREKEWDAWNLELNRKEQAELDEWSSQRRAA